MSIVAHDLKNPLSVITLRTGIMERLIDRIFEAAGADYERYKPHFTDSFDHIRQQSDKMLALVEQLLEMNLADSRVQSPRLEPVNMEHILHQVFSIYHDKAKQKDILLTLNIHNTLPQPITDEFMAHSIIENLVSNAVKFSQPKTTVEIQAYTNTEQQSVEIKVQDEGPGISEEDQKKLFQRYTKLTARPTGDEISTGLGLSIVHKMITVLHGKIAYESTLHKGTTFTASLPLKTSAIKPH